MPGEVDDQLDPEVTPAAAATTGGAPLLTLTPEQVRAHPEYQAVSQARRDDARERGRLEQENRQLRIDAENARQAAEAQRQQAIAADIAAILGDEGVEAFNQIAEISATDPAEAARKFEELVNARAQSVAASTASTEPATTDGGTTVQEGATTGSTPPPPSSGVSGDAPLGTTTTGTDWDGIARDADKAYSDVVVRNQDPVTRARVTDRERGGAFMAWLTAGYVRGMKAAGRLPHP